MWDEDSTDLPAILVVCHAESIQSLMAYLTDGSKHIPIVLACPDLQKIHGTTDVGVILAKVIPNASATLVYMRFPRTGHLEQYAYDAHANGPGKRT